MKHASLAIAASPALPIRGFADRLAALLASARLPDLAASAAAEAARLDAAVLIVAIVGEFKRGKSTLINALVGADLLPVGALPLTAVGTRVEFGEAVRVVVEFLDGHSTEIAPAEIATYATERGNPGNARRAATVVVTTPAPVLRAPLQLLDTPGIGSAFADVSAIARTLLDQADAAVLVFSAEQPASAHELDFLREVLTAGLPTFVVENKIDLVPPADRGDVVNFVSHQVRALPSGGRVQLVALSSEQARRAQRANDAKALVASGFPALESALVQFAKDEGYAALRSGARRRLIQLVDRAISALDLRQQVSPLTGSWNKQQRTAFQERANNVLFRDLLDARERVATLATEIRYRLAKVEEGIAQRCIERAFHDSLIGESDGQPVRRWAVAVETRVRQTLDHTINRWSDGERLILETAVSHATSHWPARIAEVLARILSTPPVLTVPAVDFPPPVVALPPTRFTRSFLLPSALGRRQVCRRARRWMQTALPGLIDARRAAIATTITDTLQQAEQQFHRQVTAAVEAAIANATRMDTAVAIPADDTVAAALRGLRRSLCDECNDD